MCMNIRYSILCSVLGLLFCITAARSQCDSYYEKALDYIRNDSVALEEFGKDGPLEFIVYDSTVSRVGMGWRDELCRILYNAGPDERSMFVRRCDTLSKIDSIRFRSIRKEYSAGLSKVPDVKESSKVVYAYDYNDSILMVNLLSVLDGVDLPNYAWASMQSTDILYLFVHRECEIVAAYVSGPWYK